MYVLIASLTIWIMNRIIRIEDCCYPSIRKQLSIFWSILQISSSL